MLDAIGLFVMIAGFIIGLGAVTVIDTLGFLARKSAYWTETTIRAHKVTKPLIWLGIAIAIAGGAILYRGEDLAGIPAVHTLLAGMLIANGVFLSFVISPYLLDREEKGKEREILPGDIQLKITASFFISLVGWWGSVALLIWYLLG